MQSIGGELQLVAEKERHLNQKLKEVTALHSDLQKVKIEQSQQCQVLQDQNGTTSRDKKALEERNKSLQGKNKSSAKKHRGKLLILLCSLIVGWSSSSPFTTFSSCSCHMHTELKKLFET